jgi:hypothetical protein
MSKRGKPRPLPPPHPDEKKNDWSLLTELCGKTKTFASYPGIMVSTV